jgi:hypothetical protein
MPKKTFMLNIILTSAYTVLLLCRCAWAGPSIRFEQTSFDFGRIIQGKNVSHVFEFRNTGNEVLTIQSLRAG